ncbi:glycosyltransferase family 2 protein [Paenibacillus sanguinis]|uniref:glycosyltransferase family 2 protein n=1 Tax=Paenibacillus sanguinis TaxID=225906 RepID=UPI0003A45608|nr:glycosyltransferase family 2 protein [Paenibacillus sanguinis]
MLLSLCMIVKDEADNLGRCLSSVRDAVDEIIIVDTGSTDNSISIAEAFGAKIFSYPWNGSFANARNFGLEKAKGDWILWMDADEEMEAGDANVLRLELHSRNENILLLQLKNYYGDEKPNPYQMYTVAHHRVFRNHLGFHFTNPIHEQLYLPEDERRVIASGSGLTTLPVSIHHYGYMDQAVTGKQKHERNLSMLLEEKAKDSSSLWVDYHLASEYYRIGKYEQAFEHVNQAIAQFLHVRQLPPSLFYALKYAILIETKSFTVAAQNFWQNFSRFLAKMRRLFGVPLGKYGTLKNPFSEVECVGVL